MGKLFGYLVIVASFTSCSPNASETDVLPGIPEHIKNLNNVVYSKNEIPEYKIVIERVGRFGSTDDHFVTVGGPVGGIVVDHWDRVFIRDNELNTIHVFYPNGEYKISLGREGKGPSEFMSMMTMKISESHLYVHDSQQYKVNVFSLDSLKFIYSIPITFDHSKTQNHYLSNYFPVNDSTIAAGFSPSYLMDDELSDEHFEKFFLVNNRWEIISDKILEQKLESRMNWNFKGRRQWGFQFPFNPKSVISYSADSERFYSAWSDNFLIMEYNLEGEYQQAFYYPFVKSKLIRSEIIERYDFGFENAYLDIVKNIDLPSTWPALYSMIIDDENRLWIPTIVDDRTVFQWWVLDSSGKMLAKFKLPRKKQVKYIKNNFLYTSERKSVNNEAEVVKYSLRFERVNER